MKPFAYCRDPLFLVACSLYALNRWALKPHTGSPFFQGHFNDCLLVACALPVVLWLHRCLNLRRHDGVPSLGEIIFHVATWSVLTEVVGPHVMRVTGDWRDMFAYFTGGLGAWLWWHRHDFDLLRAS